MNSYILQNDFNKRYIESFNEYAISILYGNITIGDDIEDKYRDE